MATISRNKPARPDRQRESSAHPPCVTEDPTKSDSGCPSMTFSVVEGDLFSCPKTASLAHCVSEDMCMGKGVAAEFKKRYGQVEYLKKQGAKTGGLAVLEHDGVFIYYLVTKRCHFHKPTYSSLRSSLVAMRDHCASRKVQELCMPMIGCGLDKLSWVDVSRTIKQVFRDSSISITVYHL